MRADITPEKIAQYRASEKARDNERMTSMGQKSAEWSARWEKHFRPRWIERKGKFYPAASQVPK